MTPIQEALCHIKQQLPQGVELLAVSKFHPSTAVQEGYDIGQRLFGESREQELSQKARLLPEDIQWQFIGHLQTNKVRNVVPVVSRILSVDSWRLLAEIEKQAARIDKEIGVLLELHVADESSKSGFTPAECLQLLEDGLWQTLPHIRFEGIMCMATLTTDENRIRSDFRTANTFFQVCKERFFADSPHFRIRSWGMSDDWPIAIEEGANLIRIGTQIFGPREY
ncbi:MAG: YggS family pyridoxal phosphate-dependent enzyme [Alloprevotella sp.]|nr:YggS family pyridoxal phosphate-dependent enzyme [Alloprevotella sp.]